MTSRGDEPAFPYVLQEMCPTGSPGDFEECSVQYGGMTLCEWFAGQALANPAICWRNENNCPTGGLGPKTLRKIARDANVADAMGHADALIAELEKDHG